MQTYRPAWRRGDLRQPCRQPEQRQQQGSPEPEVLPFFIRAHGGQRSSVRCKSLRGRCKSSSLQTVSPNTLAISRTSSTRGAPPRQDMRPQAVQAGRAQHGRLRRRHGVRAQLQPHERGRLRDVLFGGGHSTTPSAATSATTTSAARSALPRTRMPCWSTTRSICVTACPSCAPAWMEAATPRRMIRSSRCPKKRKNNHRPGCRIFQHPGRIFVLAQGLLDFLFAFQQGGVRCGGLCPPARSGALYV